jgi:hypothetical protein
MGREQGLSQNLFISGSNPSLPGQLLGALLSTAGLR